MMAQSLNIAYQILSGVLVYTGKRFRAATTPLIHQNHTVAVRVKQAPVRRRTTRPRPAMQKHNRYAVRIAGFFKINVMNAAVKKPLIKRLYRRKQPPVQNHTRARVQPFTLLMTTGL